MSRCLKKSKMILRKNLLANSRRVCLWLTSQLTLWFSICEEALSAAVGKVRLKEAMKAVKPLLKNILQQTSKIKLILKTFWSLGSKVNTSKVFNPMRKKIFKQLNKLLTKIELTHLTKWNQVRNEVWHIKDHNLKHKFKLKAFWTSTTSIKLYRYSKKHNKMKMLCL